MKKRIRLTEGQLHRLIEQALNEISWQTKANAANKIVNDANTDFESFYPKRMRRYRQLKRFTQAVEDDIKKKYGYDVSFTPGADDKNPRGILTLSGNPHATRKYDGSRRPIETTSFFNDQLYSEPDDLELRQYFSGDSNYDEEKGEWWADPEEYYEIHHEEDYPHRLGGEDY